MERMAGQGGRRIATKCKLKNLEIEIFGRWTFWKKYVGAVVSPNDTGKVDKAGRQHYIINFLLTKSPNLLCFSPVQQSETANLNTGQQTPWHDQTGQDLSFMFCKFRFLDIHAYIIFSIHVLILKDNYARIWQISSFFVFLFSFPPNFPHCQLKELQYRVLDQELNKWKREQQLSGNGAPFSNNLDTIQKWWASIT